MLIRNTHVIKEVIGKLLGGFLGVLIIMIFGNNANFVVTAFVTAATV